jgi:hypothetical protein
MSESPPPPIHVRFESLHGWTVRRDGETGPLSHHGTQAGAERSGRQRAQRERASFFVHGFEGRVVRTESYGTP